MLFSLRDDFPQSHIVFVSLTLYITGLLSDRFQDYRKEVMCFFWLSTSAELLNLVEITKQLISE